MTLGDQVNHTVYTSVIHSFKVIVDDHIQAAKINAGFGATDLVWKSIYMPVMGVVYGAGFRYAHSFVYNYFLPLSEES